MTQKPILVVFLQGFPKRSGGIQKGAMELYNHLSTCGYEIVYFVNKNNSKENHENYVSNHKVYHEFFPPVYQYPFTKRFWLFQKRLKKIKGILKRNYKNRQIICIADWAPDYILLGKLAQLINTKTIFSFHGPYHTTLFLSMLKDNKYMFLSTKKLINKIDKFVFVSKVLKSSFENKTASIKEKSVVILNGVEFKDNIIRKKSEPKLRCIVMGRLVTNKNIEFLIKAFEILKSEGIDFQLDIYGNGVLHETLNNYIIEHDLINCVKLCGYNSDVQQLLVNYDYYLSASLFEGLPLAPVEAISSEVIPILSNIPPHTEVLPANYSSLLFSLDDPKNLAKCLLEVLSLSENEKEKIRQDLYDYTKRNFDKKQRFNKFLDLLEDVIKKER